MKKRALTSAQEAEVAARYRRGETIQQLAEAYGCSRMPIRMALRRHGLCGQRFEETSEEKSA